MSKNKNVEIVFLAANQDAFAIGGLLGINPDTTANFSANAAGTRQAYSTVSKCVTQYRIKK